MQHRRFAHALRDFEYALQTEKVAHEMLRAEFVDEGGPGRAPLRAWLALLSRLQGVDEATRRDGRSRMSNMNRGGGCPHLISR